jgi:hypothetical protein
MSSVQPSRFAEPPDEQPPSDAGSHRERLHSVASPLGLYAEELQPGSGRHLGDFPQALTRLAVVNAVVRVVAAERHAVDEIPGAPGRGVSTLPDALLGTAR